ncbi:hypothetical protein Taro_054027 [Colocasia esculenta]|uniref:Uncharacterized protein n=1 Tax=Colocasia esculenta TaxID=4460 RepID=A0A843XPU8_COLES|nr:hypothetical protein [Colocasia esculenta]
MQMLKERRWKMRSFNDVYCMRNGRMGKTWDYGQTCHMFELNLEEIANLRSNRTMDTLAEEDEVVALERIRKSTFQKVKTQKTSSLAITDSLINHKRLILSIRGWQASSVDPQGSHICEEANALAYMLSFQNRFFADYP